MRPLPRFRSLLLTGVGDVWSALVEGARGRGEASGLLLMAVSAAAFAAMAAFLKWLLPHAPLQSVVLSRGVLMSAIFLAAGRIEGAPVLGRRPGLLLLRGLLGYGALSCYFASVRSLPLGDAVLLQYSHPVFVVALAPLLLGEKTVAADWACISAALAGVVLVVGPSGEPRPAALVGVLGSLLSGLAYLSVRELGRSEHPLTILLWFPLATIGPALVATLASGSSPWPRDGSEALGHLAVTGAALVGQVTLTEGLKRASAARATAVTLTGPVFGLGFDAVLFGRLPAPVSLLGTAIVLVAMVLLAVRAARRAG